MHNPLERFRIDHVASDSPRAHSAVSLTVNDTILRHSGQWVEVCWHNLPFPSADDYVALLVPSQAMLNETVPTKYQWAAMSASHLAHGTGCLKFRLLNMRQAVRFVLLRNGFQFPTPAAYSQEIQVQNPNEPTSGHLALTGTPGQMLVQWTTRDAREPRVKWGTTNGKLRHSCAARTHSYTRGDMCGGAAAAEGWIDPGSLHRGVITGLQPDTRYYYIFGSTEGGWSAEHSFVSLPAVGPNSSLSMLAIADMGQAEADGTNENGYGQQHPSLATMRGLMQHSEGRRLLLHNGDISYSRGYGGQWEVFADQIQPLATKLPWMTTEGNHERNWPESGDRFGSLYDSGGECGVPHHRRFKMPFKSEQEPWYSFDAGPVHFLQYSTEVSFHEGSPQHRFITADLAAVDRSVTPWIIVGGHRPFYIDSTNYQPVDGDQTVASDLRAALEQSFVDYRVDLTLHGHHHSYQRTCPIINGTCKGFDSEGVAKAPVHVVTGNAGAELCWNIAPEKPSHFQVVDVSWGYMTIDANATHLACKAIGDTGSGFKPRTVDAFVLSKHQRDGAVWYNMVEPTIDSKLPAAYIKQLLYAFGRYLCKLF